jgi:hypothetical protein
MSPPPQPAQIFDASVYFGVGCCSLDWTALPRPTNCAGCWFAWLMPYKVRFACLVSRTPTSTTVPSGTYNSHSSGSRSSHVSP